MSVIPDYTRVQHVQIIRERDGQKEVVRVYDEDGDVVLCLPAYIQDEEINLILRRLNDVYSVGYRVGDAARRRAIKKALGVRPFLLARYLYTGVFRVRSDGSGLLILFHSCNKKLTEILSLIQF